VLVQKTFKLTHGWVTAFWQVNCLTT